MAANPRCEYPAMQAISKQFQSEQTDIQNLLNQTKSKVETLHGNLWQGDAADKFFEQMENTILPSMNRLVSALGRASEVTQKVSDTIQQADEGTKGNFAIAIIGVLVS